MQIVHKCWPQVTISLVIILAIAARIHGYGDLRLSVANNDTASYAEGADLNPFSWQGFTSRRLFTTNLLYRLFHPKDGYHILANGSILTTQRAIQPSFTGLAIFQSSLSMLSWSLLAVVLSMRTRNRLLRMIMALLVTAFAFTPQLADWDSILSSESLSLSLFALQFALLITILFRIGAQSTPDLSTFLLVVFWVIVVFFWTYLKDSNLLTLVVDGLAIAGPMVLTRSRGRQLRLLTFAILGILLGFLVLGITTATASNRSQIQLINLYASNIMPYPARIEFMRDQGMPDPGSAEYPAWFENQAKVPYLKFMVAHPGFILTTYLRDSAAAFASNMQPYFRAKDAPLHDALIPYGDLLHPASSAPLLIDLLLLSGIWALFLKRNHADTLPWVWTATWLFLAAHSSMFMAVFGDTWALARHALLAVAMFRLFMWIFVIKIIDLALISPSNITSPGSTPHLEPRFSKGKGYDAVS